MPSHRLLLELGRGGMGTVYLAVTEGPGGFTKLKVVKQLRDDMAENPQLLQMFLEEARLSARLNHPNIVQTNEVGFDGRHHFIEMEYLEGQSFDALLRRTAKGGSGLPLADGVWVIAEVLAALHYAHTLTDVSGRPLRIVHRDVSPHNVFVTFEGVVKLLDFGIAKAVDSQLDTATGIVKGKVTYMAPEQALRRPLDGRSDVFSVGVMLWQLVTGERLWKDLSDFEIYMRLEAGDIPSAKSVKADADPAMDEICRKALAKEPEDRYGSAAEMRAALEAWLETVSERLGPTRLAKITTDAFADRREAIRKEIEAQLQRVARSPQDSARQVPLLAETRAYQATATDSVVDAKPSGEAPGKRGAEGATNVATKASEAEERTRTSAALVSDRPANRPSRPRWIVGALLGLGISAGAAAVAVRSFRAPRPVADAGSTAPSRGECARSAECVEKNGGHAAVCRKADHICVPVDSEDCRAVSPPDISGAEPIWFGAMYLRSEDQSLRSLWNSMELAQRDFNAVGGIPGAAEGEAHPLGLVECDTHGDVRREAEHLARLEVPVVIGFATPLTKMIGLAKEVFIPNRMMMIDTYMTGPLLTRIPQPANVPRLLWSASGGTEAFGVGLARLYEQVEPRLRRPGGSAGGGDAVRLALVRSDREVAVNVADSAVSALRLNGKPLDEAGNNFLQLTFHNDAKEAPPGETDELVAELVRFAPNVIAYFDLAVGERFLSKIEAQWRARNRPTYLSAQAFYGDAVLNFIGRSAERRHRFFAIDSPANTPENLKFVLHYNETFKPALTPATAPGVPYDAVYVAAYAAAAAQSSSASGTDLARFMSRLDGRGAPLAIGPTNIFTVFSMIREPGGSLNLTGTAAGSALAFQSNGEVSLDFAVYCFGVDSEGNTSSPIESGLRIHHGENEVAGAMRCP